MVKLEEYQHLALRTLNDKGEHENILHCIIGINSEVGEFIEHDPSKVDQRIGEAGDLFWYSAVLAHQLGIDFAGLFTLAAIESTACPEATTRRLEPEYRATIMASRMADLVKRERYYGQEINRVRLSLNLSALIVALIDMCSELHVEVEYVLTVNIKKLWARFPEKFIADMAINRDFGAESMAAGVTIE